MKVSICISLYLFLFPLFINAQEKLSDMDKQQIVYRARQTLEEFKQLLNFVASPDIGREEVQILSERAYSRTSANRIFDSEFAHIDNDIDPDKLMPDAGAETLDISSYLADFFEYFEGRKNTETSISFYNIKVSRLMINRDPILMVSFDSIFRGRHRVSNTPYQPTRRIAYLRWKKEEHHWKTFITRIAFQHPPIPFEEANY